MLNLISGSAIRRWWWWIRDVDAKNWIFRANIQTMPLLAMADLIIYTLCGITRYPVKLMDSIKKALDNSEGNIFSVSVRLLPPHNFLVSQIGRKRNGVGSIVRTPGLSDGRCKDTLLLLKFVLMIVAFQPLVMEVVVFSNALSALCIVVIFQRFAALTLQIVLIHVVNGSETPRVDCPISLTEMIGELVVLPIKFFTADSPSIPILPQLYLTNTLVNAVLFFRMSRESTWPIAHSCVVGKEVVSAALLVATCRVGIMR